MPFRTTAIEELSYLLHARKEPLFKEALMRPGGLEVYFGTLMYRFKRRASFVAQIKGIKGIGKSEFGMTTLWWGRNFHEWAGIPAEIHVAYHTSDALAQFKDCHQRGVICLLLQDERNRTGGYGSRAYVGRLINFLEQTRKAGHWYVLATPQLWEELVGVMDCYFEVQRIDDEPTSPTYRHSEVMIYTMDKGPACLLHLPIHPDEELRAKYEAEKDTHVDTVIEEEGLMEEVDFDMMRAWAEYIVKHWKGQFDITCSEIGFRFPTLGITNRVERMVNFLIKEKKETFDDESQLTTEYYVGDITGEDLLRTLIKQELEEALRHANKRKWKRDAEIVAYYLVPPFIPFTHQSIKDNSPDDHPVQKLTMQMLSKIINFTKKVFTDYRKGKVGERYVAEELAQRLPENYQTYLSPRPSQDVPDIQVVLGDQLVAILNAKLYFWGEPRSERADVECEYTWDMTRPQLAGLTALPGKQVLPAVQTFDGTSDNKKFGVVVLPRMREVWVVPITGVKMPVKRKESIGGFDELVSSIISLGE